MEKKVPVSQRAIMARINRALAKEGQALRISRSNAEKSNFGYSFIVDVNRNVVEAWGIEDFGKLAKEIGVIKDFEEVIED